MSALDPRPARCLVTGAAGYIGTRLRERFDSPLGQDYVAMVRDAAVQRALQNDGRKAVVADLLQPGQVAQALDGCDAVIHLAHGSQGPKATRFLVEAAIARKVRRFVHVSTMSVHGPKPGTEAAREETASVGRFGDEYSDSKAEQEEIVQAAFDCGDLPAVILRPTVVYGLGGHFEAQVIKQARSGEVKLFDGGQGICNAVFVDDVCDAINAALVSADALGKPMFINSDDAVSWGQFIRAFASLVEPAPRFVDRASAEAIRYWAEHPPEPVGGLPTRVLRKLKRLAGWHPPVAPWPPLGPVLRETFPIRFSNDRAKQLLGWAPRVRFDEGVALTRDWLKTRGELDR